MPCLLTPSQRLRLAFVTDDGPRLVSRDWDSSTQCLPLVERFAGVPSLPFAVRRRQRPTSKRDRQIQAVLDSMNETLNFQPGLRSPRDFAAQPIERLQADLQSLQKLLNSSQR